MKIVIDSVSFIDAIQWVMKTFDTRSENGFVGLKVSDSAGAELIYSNPTSFMKCPFKVLDSDFDGKTEASFSLQGAFIQRLASALDPTSTSQISYEDDRLTLVNKSGKFTIPTAKGRIAKTPSYKQFGEVNSAQYFDAMQRLSKYCVTDSVYAPLGAIDVDLFSDDENIVLTATDRFALGEVKVPFERSDDIDSLLGGIDHILIPSGASSISAPKGFNTASLLFDKETSKIGYSFPDGRLALYSSLDATPIPFSDLKTKAKAELTNSVQVGVKEFHKAISSISSLAWEETGILLTATEDDLVVSDSHESNKLEVEILSTDVEGENVIKFDRSILTKIFHLLSTPKMNIRWGSTSGAFVFEPVSEDEVVVEGIFILAVPDSRR